MGEGPLPRSVLMVCAGDSYCAFSQDPQDQASPGQRSRPVPFPGAPMKTGNRFRPDSERRAEDSRLSPRVAERRGKKVLMNLDVYGN